MREESADGDSSGPERSEAVTGEEADSTGKEES